MITIAGNPGTPRFGDYPDAATKTGANGSSKLSLQDGTPFTEQHYLYNPSQKGRDPDSTPDSVSGPVYDQDDSRAGYNAMCNHDGFDAGDHHITNLDERKVLDNTVHRVPIRLNSQQNGHEC